MDSILTTPIDNWSNKDVFHRLDNNDQLPSIHSSKPLPLGSSFHQADDTGSSNNNDLISANYHPSSNNTHKDQHETSEHHHHIEESNGGTFNHLLEATQTRIAQLEGANTQLRDRLHEALNDLEAAYSLLTVLQRTQKTWERHVPDATALVTAAVEGERAEQEVRNAQALRLLRSKDEALKRLDSRANEAENEALQLQNQLSSALKELDASQGKVQELIESRTKLRRQLQRQEQTNVDTVANLESQIADLKQQVVGAEEKLAESEKEKYKMSQSLQEFEERIVQLEKRAEIEEAELAEQQDVNEQLQYQLSAQLEIQKDLQSTVVSLQQAADMYKEKATLSEQQQAGLIEAYTVLQQEHVSLKQQFEAVNKDIAVVLADKASLEADKQQQQTVFEKEMEELKVQEVGLRAQLKQYEERRLNSNILLAQCQQSTAALEASISGIAGIPTTLLSKLGNTSGSSTHTAIAGHGDSEAIHALNATASGTTTIPYETVEASAMAIKNCTDCLRSISATAVELIAERRAEQSQHAVIKNLTLKLASISREAALLAAQKEELEARERLLQTFAPSSLASALPRAVCTATGAAPSSLAPAASSSDNNNKDRRQRLEGLFSLMSRQLNGLKALNLDQQYHNGSTISTGSYNNNNSSSSSWNRGYNGNGTAALSRSNIVEEEVATVQSTLDVIQDEMNELMAILGQYAEANFRWKCQEIEAIEKKLEEMSDELNAKCDEMNEMQQQYAVMEAKLKESGDALNQAQIDKQHLETQLREEQEAKQQAALLAGTDDNTMQKQREEREVQQRQYAALAQKMALSMAASEAAKAELEHKRQAVEMLSAEVASLKADNQQAAEREARLLEKIADAKKAYTEVISRLDQIEQGQSTMKESVDARLDALDQEQRQGHHIDDDDDDDEDDTNQKETSVVCVMKEASFNALITGLDDLVADAAELDRRVGVLESQADELSHERRSLRVALEARLAKADECCNALADEVERLQSELEVKMAVDGYNNDDVF